MPENFYIVSYVRFDGNAYSTTILGHHAESIAIKNYNELRDSKYIKYAQVVQRYNDNEKITFQIVFEDIKTNNENV